MELDITQGFVLMDLIQCNNHRAMKGIARLWRFGESSDVD